MRESILNVVECKYHCERGFSAYHSAHHVSRVPLTTSSFRFCHKRVTLGFENRNDNAEALSII